MRKQRKRIYIFSILIALCLGFTIWVLWGNTALMVHEFTIINAKIPDAFHGYRIVQISDLHNSELGDNHNILISKIKEAKPDILVITGDLIDSLHTKIDVSLSFARQAVKIAPTYYVTGNHEAGITTYEELHDGLQQAGVTTLSNTSTTITKEEDEIMLLGVDDPNFQHEFMVDDSVLMETMLNAFTINPDTFTILLSHRPELFDTYVESGVDLVFSGHAHGGQFRLPLLGGIIAPNQGLFPTYDGGLYTEGTTHLIVSRGIGNSILPIRINNRPEIVVVELQTT